MFTSMLSKRVVGNPIIRQCIRRMSEENLGENPISATRERSLNRVTLLGRVGNEPQKRGTDIHPVVVFSMATHVNYKTDGILKQITDWHRISVFQPNLRDLVYSYLKKGQRVHVSGRLTYGEVKEKDSDRTMSITSIIADDIIFLK